MRRLLMAILAVIMLLTTAFTSVDNMAETHVTTTSIDHISSTNKLKISVKFYTEDIESVLKIKVTDLSFKSKLSTYIDKHLQVKIKDNLKSLIVAGVNNSEKTTWGYFEVTGVDKIASMEVKNTLLMEMVDQKNIIIISANGTKKTQETKSGQEIAKFVF